MFSHHCVLQFYGESIRMCQNWAFWKLLEYMAISGLLDYFCNSTRNLVNQFWIHFLLLKKIFINLHICWGHGPIAKCFIGGMGELKRMCSHSHKINVFDQFLLWGWLMGRKGGGELGKGNYLPSPSKNVLKTTKTTIIKWGKGRRKNWLWPTKKWKAMYKNKKAKKKTK